MKRKLLFGCLIPVVCLAGLGWAGSRYLQRSDAAPDRYEKVDRGDVEVKVTETGGIEPLKKVELKSKVAGRLARLYVQEGDPVHAGQVLAEIDPTEINSQVDQMRAQCDGARARYQAALREVTYQTEQTRSGIQQAEQALFAAQARLAAAQEERRTQPGLSDSEVSQAQAGLDSAQRSLDILRQSTHPQALVQAQSSYDEARAAAENSRRNLERQQKLLDKGYVARQVVDAAESDLAAARARLDQAKKRLDLIAGQNSLEIEAATSQVLEAQAALRRAQAGRSAIAVKTQDVRAAQAAVEQARAQLASARSGRQQDRIRQDQVADARALVTQMENQLREVAVRQHDTRLVATMDGVVTQRYVEQGELITSGVSTFSSGTPVLQVADLSRMLVKMTVNEVDVHRIRPGLPVEISVDGARGTAFIGQVRKVAPAAVTAQAGGGGAQGGVIRFAVEVLVDHADARLRPGMSARCSIVMARHRGVVRAPGDCVQGDGAAATVQVPVETVKEGRKVTSPAPRKIVAGLRSETYVEIVSGLKEGDRVKPGVFRGPKRRTVSLDMH